MSVVQPVLVTELVVVLVLRGVWIRQDVAAAWVSVLVVCLAVAEFFIAAEPTGGHPVPETKEWLAAGLVFGAAIAVLAAVGWPTGPPARRLCRRGRAHLGLGGDLPQGRDHTLTAFGIAGMFTRWQVYALIAAGVAGTLLEQAACVGPLSVSQPTLFIVNPFASIILSVWLFDERFTNSPGKITATVLSFAVMAAGSSCWARYRAARSHPLRTSQIVKDPFCPHRWLAGQEFPGWGDQWP
jgi:hypothetical protein